MLKIVRHDTLYIHAKWALSVSFWRFWEISACPQSVLWTHFCFGFEMGLWEGATAINQHSEQINYDSYGLQCTRMCGLTVWCEGRTSDYFWFEYVTLLSADGSENLAQNFHFWAPCKFSSKSCQHISRSALSKSALCPDQPTGGCFCC